jgi:protein FAM32A
MAPDEYSTGGGGKLKLKGSKVSDGRVDKKKKKKAKKEKDAAQSEQAEQVQRPESGEADAEAEAEREASREREEEGGSSAKTEAEKKYEEVRRKRVCQFSSLFSLCFAIRLGCLSNGSWVSS